MHQDSRWSYRSRLVPPAFVLRRAALCLALAALVLPGCGKGLVTIPPEQQVTCAPDNPSGTCPSGETCVSGACAAGDVIIEPPPATCTDGVKNGTEADVDCGGGCPACKNGAACSLATQCQSGVCSGTCRAAICSDGVKNDTEADIDCGGACPACADGATCTDAVQCQSGVCNGGTCRAPSCNDLAKNGDETGVDCGGSCAPAKPCGNGTACLVAGDCTSGICDVGVHTCVPATCVDLVRNATETDVDCGGACASAGKKCNVGQSCLLGFDCIDNACPSGVCTVPSCSDGALNGQELAVDCGGPVCVGCGAGAPCDFPSDCQSGACTGGVCRAPSCGDLVKNGSETGVDCGGSCAPGKKCGDGAACLVDGASGDCQSSHCSATSHTCIPASCTNTLLDPGETAADCGGPNCAPCASGKACIADADCQSSACVGSICQAASCTDGVKNQGEVDVDCGGPCALCAAGKSCTLASQCLSGLCVGQKCLAAGCSNTVRDGLESDIDCGGNCTACATGKKCNGAPDCASLVCAATVCAAATCSDGVANGGETDIDCGFAACSTTCAVGSGCASDWDCSEHVCNLATHLCATASCTDGVKNGSETGSDCGGGCGPCANGVGCAVNADCQSGVCNGSTHICLAPSCTDGVKNGSETATDCGGATCVAQGRRCANGLACIGGTDCQSTVCTALVCVAPHCSNFSFDPAQGETDLNCGGTECPPCVTSQQCFLGRDCTSGSCGVNNSCTVATGPCTCQGPGCFDNVQNGNETGIDCGGTCVAGCANGSVCLVASDCVSGVCATGRCQAPSCIDGIRNGDEMGIDCGGTCALTYGKTCADGASCLAEIDCQSEVCGAPLPTGCPSAPSTPCACQVPSCSPPDGVKNGIEHGIDCGAPGCVGCPSGTPCGVGGDCASFVCSGAPLTCQPALCTDSTKNGSETDFDCGGGTCAGCAANGHCLVGTDCAAGLTCGAGNVCVSGTCTNLTIDGDETDQDCGGAVCPPCADALLCYYGADCQSGVCGAPVSAGGCSTAPSSKCACQTPTCSDGVANGGEPAVDCGGPCVVKCAAASSCNVASDCTSDVCSGTPKACQLPSCFPKDNVENGNETDVDCGGTDANCPACGSGAHCLVPADCTSGVCSGTVCQAPSCIDALKNGLETDVDCGGALCGAVFASKCVEGQACTAPATGVLDCQTFVCDAVGCSGSPYCCQAPSCSDGQPNGTETDIDCGGSCAPAKACAVGKFCSVGGDCQSGVCDGTAPTTCQAPSCNPPDGVWNGSETDVDCGGADLACPRCGTGAKCNVSTDCTNNVCAGGFCSAASCIDTFKNGLETDIDCGGALCGASYGTKCNDGWACGGLATGVQDCKNKICGTLGCGLAPYCCQVATCIDGQQNGLETDLDCGGATCIAADKLCADTKLCTSGADCQSGVCAGTPKRCQAASCPDGIRNNNETDTDCGGLTCATKCALKYGCVANTDCVSGRCDTEANGGTVCNLGFTLCCQASGCTDSLVDGLETDVDCGGLDCAACAVGLACLANSDCVTGLCDLAGTKKCLAPSCGDNLVNGAEDCEPTVAITKTCTQVLGKTSTGTLRCTSSCAFDTSSCCGDGKRQPLCVGGANAGKPCAGDPDCASGGGTCTGGETCDGADVGAATCASVVPTLSGTLLCNSACTGYVTTGCTGCGNDRIEGSEACDGTALGPVTCVTLGFEYGTPICAADCSAVLPTGCANYCGNGVVDGGRGEFCDPPSTLTAVACPAPFTGGARTCNSTCNGYIDTSCTGGCGNNFVDGGETCDATALAGKDCTTAPPAGTYSGGTLECAAGCLGYVTTGCWLCGDGVVNKACSISGAVCTTDLSCGVGGTCTTGEKCDGLALDGKTCAALGFGNTGTPLCNGVCGGFTAGTCSTCGDNTIAGAEVCDGAALAGKTCTNFKVCYLGTNDGKPCMVAGDCPSGSCVTATGGSLACNGSCSGYDATHCTYCDVTACSAIGGTCNVTTGACECSGLLSLCGSSCVSLRTDPNHCGTCTTVCSGLTPVCSAGVCVGTSQCQTPTVACSGSCVDTKTDKSNCGSCGNVCSGATPLCSSGTCAASAAGTLTKPPKYGNTCPAVDLNLGTAVPPLPGAQSCAGDLASVTFRWALCSCGDIGVPNALNRNMFTDGFDSTKGPYRPVCEGTSTTCTQSSAVSWTPASGGCTDLNGDGLVACAGAKGAGIGANGIFNQSSATALSYGAIWWAGGAATTISTLSAEQELHIGGVLPGAVRGRSSAFVEGNIAATGGVTGTLHQSLGMSQGAFTYGALDQSSVLDVTAPCDCAQTNLINVVNVVTEHACTHVGTGAAKCNGDDNDNYAAGLSPDVFNGTAGGVVELPCGLYYLSTIDPTGSVTIVAKERVALFIGGDIKLGASSQLYIEPGPAGEVDIFVKGGVCLNGANQIGSPNFPARTRIYVSGGDLCAPAKNSGACALIPGCSWVAGSCVAAGSIGSGAATCAPSNAKERALDLGTFSAAANVYAPWGAVYAPQTLAMYGGLLVGNYLVTQETAIHFDTGISAAGATCPSDCGNGKLDGTEQCDGALLNAKTCVTQGFAGGTLLCSNSCLLDTTACYKCGDGEIDVGEACDPGNATAMPPIPANLNGKTCVTELGASALGAVTCNGNCTLNSSACHRCGNSVIETGEICDGNTLPVGVICQTLGYDGGTLSCNGTCSGYNTLGCYKCGDGVINSGEVCDPGDPLAVPAISPSPLNPDCASYGYTGGSTTCRADCTIDRAACTMCDDQVRQGSESCDGADLAGKTCATMGLGYTGGTLGCSVSCTFDMSACCGNGVVTWPEQCEGSVPSGTDCISLGFGGGTLACGTDCRLDTGACTAAASSFCANGIREGGEQCDGAFTQTCQMLGYSGGLLGCNDTGGSPTCTWNFSQCTFCGNGVRQKVCTGDVAFNNTPCTADSQCGAGTCTAGEQCDGTDFGADSCVARGMTGNLLCRANCTVDASGCSACGNNLAETGETCDGTDLRGQTCATMGFTGGQLKCLAGCGAYDTSGCYKCGDTVRNMVCASGANVGFKCTTSAECGGAACNYVEECDPPTSTATCASLSAGTGTATCRGNCTWELAACVKCGNNTIEGGEICDGTALSGQTCVSQGYSGGTLLCLATCLGYDKTGCYKCGDGTVNAGESCDPGAAPPSTWNLNGQTCQSAGLPGGPYTNGTLGCASNCSFDTNGCYKCGDGAINSGETCDPGNPPTTQPALSGYNCTTVPPAGSYTGGTLDCLANCSNYDKTGCYKCGDGAVNKLCSGGSTPGAPCTTDGNCGGGTCTAGEACDPGATPPGTEQLDSKTCSSFGFTGGTLHCKTDGTCQFNFASCTGGSGVCGDGAINSGEQCDPGASPPSTVNLGGAVCSTLGYTGTGLTCYPTADAKKCLFDTRACCGDGVKGGAEVCDGADVGGKTCATLGVGFISGTLGCKSDCSGYDTSGCSECADCRDCNNQACIGNRCSACTDSAQCCSPYLCLGGSCTLF